MDSERSTNKQDGRTVLVTEFEFPDTLIGRLRRSIHALAGQWAVRHLMQQQNEINIQQNQTGVFLKESLQAVDQDLVQTRKQVAELTTLVIQQQKQIEKLKAAVEAKSSADSPEG
ncbi:MAG: hypothetical protein AB8G95_19715 [Anaerolineae bacterium]